MGYKCFCYGVVNMFLVLCLGQVMMSDTNCELTDEEDKEYPSCKTKLIVSWADALSSSSDR